MSHLRGITCYIVAELNIQILHGSVATDMRWGGRSYSIFFCSSSEYVTVKELLKLVHICESWGIMRVPHFFETQCSNVVSAFKLVFISLIIINLQRKLYKLYIMCICCKVVWWYVSVIIGRFPRPDQTNLSNLALYVSDGDAVHWQIHCCEKSMNSESFYSFAVLMYNYNVKVKERIAVSGVPYHSYETSLAIWDHTVLPATRHKLHLRWLLNLFDWGWSWSA